MEVCGIDADKYDEFHRNTTILPLPLCATVQFDMDKGDAQPVLRCGQCNKPFDKRKFHFHQALLYDPESKLNDVIIKSPRLRDMDTIVGLEKATLPIGLDLVFLV